MTTRIPVLIIGAGPVGLSAAHVLGLHGIASTVCEQFPGINPHPRAHVVNTRTMELFRSWGVADAVSTDALPMDWMTRIIWTTTLAGEELGRLDMMDASDESLMERLSASAVTTVSCAQDRVQHHLVELATGCAVSDVRFNTKVVEVTLDDDGVDVVLETPDGTEHVRIDYLIGADGATSWLRDQLGIRMTGMPPLAQQVNVYFHADLSSLTDGRGAVLYWTINSAARGVFVAMDAEHRWTFNFEYNPAVESVADYTVERCTRIIHDALGTNDIPIEIQRIGGWTMCAETASAYRKGRAFLAGDAAHRFPPTGGIGMNTGIVDADNLAWKLAAVINGWAGTKLLDSYQAERRPVALSNSQYSVSNALKMSSTGIGATADGVIERLESTDPLVATAERARLVPAIQDQREHFGALNQDLGFCYDRSDAIVGDDTSPPILHNHATDFVATARPGSRLPHVWLARDNAIVSTLDLVGPHFLLLTGRAGDSWIQQLELVPGIPHHSYRLGVDLVDIDSDVHAAFEIDEDGCVLVRPDGHVAFRIRTAQDAAPDALTVALNHVLDRAAVIR